jgi:hypothetical protein
MAIMKNIYIDLENIYGVDLIDAPDDFSVDDYIKELSEKSKQD